MRAVLSGTDDLPRNLEVMQVYDRIDDAFPGGQIPASSRSPARTSRRPAVAASIKDLETRAVASGRFNGPVDVTVSQGQARRPDRDPDQGRRHRRRLQRRPRRPARQSLVPQTVGRARRRHAGLRRGHDRRDQGLRRLPQGPRAAGRRLRPDARVPAAAGHVPLDRDPDQGDRAQPAVGGRRLRRADLGLPGRPLREACSASSPTAA